MAVQESPKMPTSPNESLATYQASGSEAGQTTSKDAEEYSESQREPLSSQQSKLNPGITFAAQDRLPKLPIPELESTCKKYLEALRPLQSTREYEESVAAVGEFKRHEGLELQERLKKYATGKTSYIEQFCRYIMGHVVRIGKLMLKCRV